MDYFVWIGSVWTITVAVGALGFPVSSLIFSASSDGGYTFSKILSWFAIGYLTFLIATLGLVPLAFPAIIVALFVWAIINAFVYWRMHDRTVPIPRLSQIVTTELIFLSVRIRSVVYNSIG